MVAGAFFRPCEAMRFLLTGVRLAAGANFYIPEMRGETERRERVPPAFCLVSRGSGARNGEDSVELLLFQVPSPSMGEVSRQRPRRNSRNLIDVMLSEAKHLAFSRCYEDEILRLRLRMTLRHSLLVQNR